MKPRIAIFSGENSAQAADVAAAVKAQGGTPLVFDIGLGGATAVSLRPGGGSWQGCDFADIAAIHIRCTAPNTMPSLPPLLNAASFAEQRLAFLREQSYQATTYAFFEHLAGAGKLVVNRLTRGFTDHNAKAQLFQKLRRWRIGVPETISTNPPGTAAAFVERHGEVVAKPAIGVGSTRLVDVGDRARLAEVALCPVLLQRFVAGQTLRLHVVGDKVVLPLEIDTQGHVDSRTAPTAFRYTAMAPSHRAQVVRATRLLGLHYAAWDGIVGAEDGRLYLLDCNPGPSLMWIGPDFREIVCRGLASYLVAWAQSGSLRQARAAVQAWSP